MAYYKTKQATPEMKAIWKENIYFVNKLKVGIIMLSLLARNCCAIHTTVAVDCTLGVMNVKCTGAE